MAKMRKRNTKNLFKPINKKALVIGITGQDGINLTKLLLKKNFSVIGVSRNIKKAHAKLSKTLKLNKITIFDENFFKLDSTEKFLIKHKPKYIFFLAGQSSVGRSFERPMETYNSNIMPVMNILEYIRKFSNQTRIYNSSSSEIFGNQGKKKLNEKSNYFPISPYGSAKAITTDLIKSYRESFEIKAYNGICFNHESIHRNSNFLFGKLLKILKTTKNKKVKFGSSSIVRDWGLSEEYVSAFLKIILSKQPDDYVIATGRSYSIKEVFIKILGKKNFNKKIIFDENLKRPNEIFFSYADPRKIKKKLNWKARKYVTDIFKNND